jgi:hypothetical protein
MSTYKNVNDNYTITCQNGTGIFTVNAANINFNGQVTQIGNTTVVYDFITVAANNNGSISDMGLLAQKNTTNFAGLRFDTVANAWQISSSVTASGAAIAPYQTISAGTASAAGSNTQIQFNNNGTFGASANLSFNYASNVLTLSGAQVLINSATPANVANGVVLYSNTVGAGGTGLYFTSSAANDELVSKSKSILYSIIF